MFEEHTMIRRAAIQCWTNLCTSPLMAKRCEAPNDLVKYTVLLIADDEDQEICKAAAGALAMLTGQSEKCCKKVFEVSIGKFTAVLLKKTCNLGETVPNSDGSENQPKNGLKAS